MQSAHATDPLGRLSGLLEMALDRVLGVVRQLEPVGREQLDPVVLVGVVRRRDDRGHVELVAAQQQRRRRGRQHSAEQRVAARRGDPCGDRRLEHLARLAGVADDQHLRPLGACLLHRGPRQCERELGRQELSGAAPDTVRAEQLPGQGPSA